VYSSQDLPLITALLLELPCLLVLPTHLVALGDHLAPAQQHGLLGHAVVPHHAVGRLRAHQLPLVRRRLATAAIRGPGSEAVSSAAAAMWSRATAAKKIKLINQ